jgi:pimeloyl-ACP methyl ester carboxylesterase
MYCWAALVNAQITHPCRVEGMPNEVQCGTLQRALDPASAGGPSIEVHYMVVPAMARNKQPDPVLLLAGGPGQSAIDVAQVVMSRLGRLNNRRDLIFIDQRGTGRSAPLQCADESRLPLQQVLDPLQQIERLHRCVQTLGKLPNGDLRFYTTTIAMQDFDAVREQLGVVQWNLIGSSYGTRAALEYQRQFPGHVRRTVIDGVAPPDMVLPVSFSIDGQAALEKVLNACETDMQGEWACAKRFPRLRQEWAIVLKSLPRVISVGHPVSGAVETFNLTRDALLRSVRAPLYAPFLAAGLPAVIHQAFLGRFEGLIGLSGALGNNSKSMRLAMGMHFSVVCAEDGPRIGGALQTPATDFGTVDADLYSSVCKFWPRGQVPDAFFTVPAAQSPVLVLSGGADPVTPIRHGERVTRALGAKAQHIVVAEAGHGVMGVGCMRDIVFRFITAASDSLALPQDASCATHIPRPGVFLPIRASVGAGVKP